MGSFYDYTPKQGAYLANPSFDESIMELMAYKLIEALDHTDQPLGFFITIPVWDTQTVQQIYTKCGTERPSQNYPFKTLEVLMGSKYLFHKYTICRDQFPYYNIAINQTINVSNTYLIVLKNQQMNWTMKQIDHMLSTINPPIIPVK
jgi:hypothetical protein